MWVEIRDQIENQLVRPGLGTEHLPGALCSGTGSPALVKEESEKVDFKLNIQKTKIMASGPTTSWEIDGETVETVSDFILLDTL